MKHRESLIHPSILKYAAGRIMFLPIEYSGGSVLQGRPGMSAKRFLCLVLGLFSLLCLGAVASAGAYAGNRLDGVRLATGDSRSSLQILARPDLPHITPTPALPDYVPYMTWDNSYPCPYPVLRVGSGNIGTAVCWGSIMRLENSAGQYGISACQASRSGLSSTLVSLALACPIPGSDSMPFTLTVDYGNAWPERDETNNIVVFTDMPPQASACGVGTGTPTPTAMPSITPTATHTPAFPNLVGSEQWVTDCPRRCWR